METIEIIEATLDYTKDIWQFRQEVFESDADNENRFAGCLSLDACSSAEEWIEMCQLRKS